MRDLPQLHNVEPPGARLPSCTRCSSALVWHLFLLLCRPLATVGQHYMPRPRVTCLLMTGGCWDAPQPWGPQTSAELPLPLAPAPYLPRTALGSPRLLDLCALGVLGLGSAPTSAVTGFSFNSVMWAVAWPGLWMPLYWSALTHTSCWALSSPRLRMTSP